MLYQNPQDFGGGSGIYFLNGSYLLSEFVLSFADNEEFNNSSSVVVAASQALDLYRFSFTQQNLEEQLKTSLKGKTIFFRVFALNVIGMGEVSSTVYARLITTPSAPLDLTVSVNSFGILVRWSIPADTGDGTNVYQVQRYLVEMDKSNFTDCPVSSSSCLFAKYSVRTCSCAAVAGWSLSFRPQNLSKGALYFFRVFAENEAGLGLPSASSGSRALFLPTAPKLPVAIQTSTTSATLTWAPPSDFGMALLNETGAGNYMLDYSVMPNFEVFESILQSENTARINNLGFGLNYFFRVAALNYAGLGPYSSTLNVQLDSEPEIILTYVQGTYPYSMNSYGTIPVMNCNEGSSITVVLSNVKAFNPVSDKLNLNIFDSVLSASSVSLVSEACGLSDLMRITIGFVLPDLWDFCTLSGTFYASIINTVEGQDATLVTFPFQISGPGMPKINFLFPSVGSDAGGTMVLVSIDGISMASYLDDFIIYYSSALASHNITVTDFQTVGKVGAITLSNPPGLSGSSLLVLKHRKSGFSVII